MSQKQLPKGWKWKKLGDLLLPQESINPREYPDKIFLYIDITSIDQSSHYLPINPRSIQGNAAPTRARKVVRTGDVIYATTRPYLRNIALIDNKLDGQVCSTAFCVLRTGIKAIPEYIYYFVQTSLFLDQIMFKMRGSNYPAISDGDLFDTQIPLPPIPVQRAIVTILNKANSTHFKRAEAQQLSLEASNALFIEILGHPATNFKKWPVTPLTEFLEQVRRTVNTRSDDNYKQVTVRWYGKGAEVRKHGLGSERKTERQYLVKKGDFIYSRIDARKGAFAIAKDDINDCIATSDFPTFKINLELVRLAFLEVLVRLPYFWDICAQASVGTTNRSRLNEAELLKIRVPIPPIKEQDRFIQANNRLLLSLAKQTVSEIDSRALFSSFLVQAFTGELTAEWEATNAEYIAAEVARLEQRPRLALLRLITLRQQLRPEPVGITCLMKYAFLAQKQGEAFSQPTNYLYDFVPYHFGPFAQDLYSDLTILEEEGWLVVERTTNTLFDAPERTNIFINPERTPELESEVKKLSEAERTDLVSVIEKYGNLSHNDLLDTVYAQYSAYARKSRLRRVPN